MTEDELYKLVKFNEDVRTILRSSSNLAHVEDCINTLYRNIKIKIVLIHILLV